MKTPGPKAPLDVFPTEHEIAQRAFELCFIDREAGGDPRSYLEAAEDELLDRAVRRALAADKPRQ